jgi:plastocyanin
VPGPGGGAGPTTTPTVPADPPAQQALGVTVDERDGYTMVLSRTRLSSGSVTVQLNNQGDDPHNLRIVRTEPASGAPVDLPETGPDQHTNATLALGPGTYYLFCTLTTPVNHADAGMHATLRVDP